MFYFHSLCGSCKFSRRDCLFIKTHNTRASEWVNNKRQKRWNKIVVGVVVAFGCRDTQIFQVLLSLLFLRVQRFKFTLFFCHFHYFFLYFVCCWTLTTIPMEQAAWRVIVTTQFNNRLSLPSSHSRDIKIHAKLFSLTCFSSSCSLHGD